MLALLIRRLAASGHKQKEIAEKVGLSKGHVSEIVNKKSSEIEHSPTIKSTSAAEELEDGRNIRDVDKVSHKEVADMAAVHYTFVAKIRDNILHEITGKQDNLYTPTITPKYKEKSSEDTQRLKDELARLKAEKDALAFMQPIARKRTPISRRPSMFHVKHKLLTFPR